MTGGADLARAEQLLHSRFGHRRFREGQAEAIAASLAGRDLVAVMPTGAGKSLCYQLPALLADGYCLVVSPLIALMKDQVDQLVARGIAAGAVHSGTSPDARWRVAHGIEAGELKLLLVAPERFRSARFLEFVRRLPPTRFAIDEAHCISQWGHDFRPDYRRLGEVVEALGRPPISALTATATPEVRRDIAEQLDLRDPLEVLTGFDRPNLSFEVVAAPARRDKIPAVEKLVAETAGTRLIYAATRRAVEELSQALAGDDLRVGAYHAGLSDEERSRVQDAFMADELDALVATNAFGMGVDKRDIRLVLHHDMPGSLEAYYQEAGRAGRDGEPARCVLLHHGGDFRLQKFFVENANPEPRLLERLYALLRTLSEAGGSPQGDGATTVEVLQTQLDERNDGALRSALAMLARLDAVRLLGDVVVPAAALPDDLPVDLDYLRLKRRSDENRLSRMWEYGKSRIGCRFGRIRRYFLGSPGEPCERCDLCSGDGPPRRLPSEDERRRICSVLETVQELDLRFGPHRIAKILRGDEDHPARRGREEAGSRDESPLRGAPLRSVREFIDYLEVCGLLYREPFESPDGSRRGSLLGITDSGRQVARGEWTLELPPCPEAGESRSRRPREAPASTASPGDAFEQPPDGDLVARLRRFRSHLAQVRGVPAYRIFSNRTLDCLARRPPRDEASFLAVDGLGEKRWNAFGAALIEELAHHDEEGEAPQEGAGP